MNEEKLDRSITAAIQSRRIDGSIQPLTKPPGYYLTSDEGSPCERLEPKWQGKSWPHFEFGASQVKKPEFVAAQKAKNKQMRDMVDGIDIDEFKKQCEDIERGES